jgi:hypothetical protein
MYLDRHLNHIRDCEIKVLWQYRGGLKTINYFGWFSRGYEAYGGG